MALPSRPARLLSLLLRPRAGTAIVAIAVGLRLALILALPQTPVSDGGWYMARAAEMARGLGYQEAGWPTAFWPVGYPALLAGSMLVAGPGMVGPMLVNILSSAAIVALILWFARALGIGLAGGRLAALGYAIYPAAIAYAGCTTSETSSTAVALAGFALLVGGRDRALLLAAAGLMFGAATLMRAQMLLFPAGAVVAMLLALPGWPWRRALKAALIVHLAMAAAVLPWTWRNERVLHAPVLVSTNGGVALYTGAYDGATGDYTDWETAGWERASGVPWAERVPRQVEADRNLKAAAKGWIADHPRRWLALGLKKTALLWRKDTDGFWSLEATYPAAASAWTLVQAGDQLFYVLLLALAMPCWAAGLRGMWRRDAARAPLALTGVMPAFVSLTAFGFTGQIRYHYPAMPFVALAAGWTATRLFASWRARAEAASGHRAGEPHAAVLAARLGHEA